MLTPNNVLPLQLKQIFPPIIQIFTECEGGEIESRLPFKIFSTLIKVQVFRKGENWKNHPLVLMFRVNVKTSGRFFWKNVIKLMLGMITSKCIIVQAGDLTAQCPGLTYDINYRHAFFPFHIAVFLHITYSMHYCIVYYKYFQNLL